jgi:peptidyl-dipeptidase A
MDKIGFLPFGLLIDSGAGSFRRGHAGTVQQSVVGPKAKYQGIAPPVDRSEADFDPGAKYHRVNTPYVRTSSRGSQFQFHRARARRRDQRPCRCSIYRNKAAVSAERVEYGQEQTVAGRLEAISGQRQMDATAILDYFAPLKKWLDEQNQGEKPGWQGMDTGETAPRHTSR